MRFQKALLAIASTILSIAASSLPGLAQSARLTARDIASQINLRAAPSTQAAWLGFGLVGDRVEVLNQMEGLDRQTWYFVRFEGSRAEGWIRQDFIRFNAPPPAPSNARPAASSVRPAIDPLQTFTAEQIAYFLEVAMSAEWGSSDSRIKRWAGDIRIKVNGFPTTEDLTTLRTVISEINELTNGALRLEISDRNPNMQFYFVPQSTFSRYESNYVSGNLGFFWANWTNNIITNATVLIATDGVTQPERSHLIREELTQSLGLMEDSWRYEDSIFYQGWTATDRYSDLDRALITMLYRPEIRPGMTRSRVATTLAGIRSPQQPVVTQTPRSTPASNAVCIAQRDSLPLDFSNPVDRCRIPE